MKCTGFGYGKWILGKREPWSKLTNGDGRWRMIDDGDSWPGNGVYKAFVLAYGWGRGSVAFLAWYWYWYYCCL